MGLISRVSSRTYRKMSYLKDLDNLLNTNLVSLSDDENDAKLVEKDEDYSIETINLPKKTGKGEELADEKYAGKAVKFDDLRSSGPTAEEIRRFAASDDEMESDEDGDDDESFVDSLVGGGREDDQEDDDDITSNDEADDLTIDEPPIKIFKSNSATIQSAKSTHLQLKIIENLYSSRIKLQKLANTISDNKIIDEEEEKYQNGMQRILVKYKEVCSKIQEISRESDQELINHTFERTRIGGFSKLERNPNDQIDEILKDRERLIKNPKKT